MTNILDSLGAFGSAAGLGLGYILVGVLCLGGLALSCVSLSGTWLVALGALMAALLSGSDFPGAWTVGGFLVVSALVEVLESMAGAWGVQKRGGSALAGFAALAGGIAGLFLGAAIPVPLVGSLIGMLAGSFLLAYAVEAQRLRHGPGAAHIARGAVVARLLMLLLKVVVTLAMTIWLWVGIFAG